MKNSATRPTEKVFQPREDRIVANPTDRNYVQFGGQGLLFGTHPARFGDISSTGMKLIARQPTHAKVGDIVDLRFSLPGSRALLKTRALITRKVNEFEFAVAFMDFASSRKQIQLLNGAIRDYLTYLGATPFAKQVASTLTWVRDHRRGLTIASFGLIVFAAASLWIYQTSDEHNGRELKSWGKAYPKQWAWDYYDKIPKRK